MVRTIKLAAIGCVVVGAAGLAGHTIGWGLNQGINYAYPAKPFVPIHVEQATVEDDGTLILPLYINRSKDCRTQSTEFLTRPHGTGFSDDGVPMFDSWPIGILNTPVSGPGKIIIYLHIPLPHGLPPDSDWTYAPVIQDANCVGEDPAHPTRPPNEAHVHIPAAVIP